VALIAITFIPQLTLWLPKAAGMIRYGARPSIARCLLCAQEPTFQSDRKGRLLPFPEGASPTQVCSGSGHSAGGEIEHRFGSAVDRFEPAADLLRWRGMGQSGQRRDRLPRSSAIRAKLIQNR
jgi:hypothetical protein